ncbi:MAG: methionyl-tRNA formyltransferase [Dehalococcoidia bacterium]|nr:methionyl-tRNA formyltransferase [Dehalococcoidia bacterium]
MRVVLLGSPAFTLPALEALIAGPNQIVAVITQPDRPAGRGHALAPPPVKSAALAHGLNVLQPVNVSSPESVAALQALEPDVFVVAAYGQILRQRLLDVPKRGSLNVHASLLPRHRGASPIAAAILAGDEVTGVTVMEVVRALDAGPMVAKVEEPITPFDTAGSLEERLSLAGAELLARVLDPWAAGDLPAEPQDDELATYAPQLKREEALIDWTLPAVETWRRVRAFNPWPVAYTSWRGEELRIWEAWPLDGETGQEPGTILTAATLPPEAGSSAQTFSVQTGRGRLAILKLQRQGRQTLAGLDFLRGQRDLVGSRFG